MRLRTFAAVLAVATLPLCAQAQQPKAPPKPTKADAQKVIKTVSTDKVKTKLYCDIAALSEQIDAASQKKDEKKVDELAQKANKIGPEFVALMDGLQDMNPDSKEAEEIGSMLEALDKLCEKK